MRRAGEISPDEFVECLAKRGIYFQTGPFVVHLRSDIEDFGLLWRECYRGLSLLPEEPVAHFRISVLRNKSLLRRLHPQALFFVEGIKPFDPYPIDHAFPMFEWGLNWCVGTMAHNYLLLHSAALEMNGKCVIMPAQPGSGKSTLCAAMTGRQWRLLSDEFGIIDKDLGMVHPFPRAAPLKNESIEVIRAFAPKVRLGPKFDKTRKGVVAHLFPSDNDLSAQETCAEPALIVFPRFEQGAPTSIVDQPRAVALNRLVNNSFNYLINGEQGFDALCDVVEQCECIQLTYSELDDAIAEIEGRISQL